MFINNLWSYNSLIRTRIAKQTFHSRIVISICYAAWYFCNGIAFVSLLKLLVYNLYDCYKNRYELHFEGSVVGLHKTLNLYFHHVYNGKRLEPPKIQLQVSYSCRVKCLALWRKKTIQIMWKETFVPPCMHIIEFQANLNFRYKL